MKPYFLINGIKELSKEFKGKANIYLGIRPYGFHAGNQLPFMVYPYLLCKFTKELGFTPKFNFFLFLNDWEQDALEGPDLANYPFNIFPKNTTFQFTPSPDGKGNIVDFYEPIIATNVKKALEDFKQVKVIVMRNSSMKKMKTMKDVVLKTIVNPKLVRNVLKKYSGKSILKNSCSYCNAICKSCNSAKTETKIMKDQRIRAKCLICGSINYGPYESFEYWLYHKPLALPRIYENKIDLCITGLDHYNEGDFVSRKELFKIYGLKVKYPKTLYSHLIKGANGLVMGKSKKNDEYMAFPRLLKLVIKYGDNSIIDLSK
ncbi:hypothetical protein GYA19_00575 [Candidatus Beckwithbacteria bacterium]|nr:hypothetical protein [Candidatus Beckwithbacteria bacterium]